MHNQPPLIDWDPETVQIRGFSTGIHQVQILLVVVVLIYVIFAVTPPAQQLPALLGTLIYFVFVAAVSYRPLVERHRRWLIALHTWVMIAFITWVLYAATDLNSPLISLYMLAVIIGALALGMRAALLEVGLIAACYLLLIYLHHGLGGFTAKHLARGSAHIAMFLLVGFLTTILANAIHSANQRIQELASRDTLTGLYNRSVLRTITAPLFAGTIRDERPFCVLVADMDNLKTINDRYGHDAGDEAIVACARVLKATLRESDIVARHGGDEFVAFLPNTRSEDAVALAKRLLDAAGNTSIEGGHPRLSLGIASFPEHGKTVEELMSNADTAMYQVKRAGGNSMAIFQAKSTA